MSPGQFFATKNSSECAGNIAQTIAWCQTCLRLRSTTPDKGFHYWNVPAPPYEAGQELALVIAALSRPCWRERHGYEQVSLLSDVPRKVKSCHLFCHWLGQRSPARILEPVDNLARCPTRHPADRTDSSNEGRKQFTPAAGAGPARMPAADTVWRWHAMEALYAQFTEDPMIRFAQRCVAADACPRQQQVEGRSERRAGSRDQALGERLDTRITR